MKMRQVWWVSALTLALLGALGDEVRAEDPAEPTSSYSETITVTASRTPVSIEEIGSSVTVIDRDEIDSRQSLFLGDLLRGVPGLAISRGGGAGSFTQARVRGAEANQVLVLIDGVAVNDAFAGDEISLELLTSYDIERIEIVRGPQSGLWGSDALAGVINIITRDVSSTAGPEAEIEAGSFGTLRGGGRLAFGRRDARVGVTGSYVDLDGTNVARVGDEDDGSTNGTATVRFQWDRPDHPFQVDVVGRHTDATSDFDAIDFAGTGLPIDDDRTTETELTLLRAVGRWTPINSAWQHEVHASVTTSDTESFIASDSSGSTAMDKRSLSLQSSVELGSEASSLGQRLTLSVDHENREFEQRGAASPFGDPNQDQDMNTTGAVAEYRVGTPSRWLLSASVRHDDNSDFDDATTYRTTASVAVGQGETRLRASAGTGQKPPTFLERFGFFPDTFIGNPDLEPETSRGWEVGINQHITRSSRLELTYFNEQLKHEINGFFFDPGLGVFTARNEPTDSDRQGVEFLFHSDIGARTHLVATYTYTDATQPDPSGNDEEIRRPRHLANLRVRHALNSIPLDLQINLAYTGSQVDLFFPPFPQPSQRVRLDSYLLADVTARYRVGERFEVFGRVENVIDETYEDVFGFATPGLGAYAGLRFHAAPAVGAN